MLTIKIHTDNAAFGEERFEKAAEIRRILSRIENEIELGVNSGFAVDINGNRVGFWEITD